MQLISVSPINEIFYDLEDLPNEIWKPVLECPNYYICSNYGRIKTLYRNGVKKSGCILKQALKKDGYYQVVLNVKGKKLYRRVNRIVAQAFVPNINELPLVDHKDNNPLNNKADNLQWITNSGNIKKYIKEVYDGKYKGRGKIQPKHIIAFNENEKYMFNSVFECSVELFGVKTKRGGISKAVKTKKKYLGWYFEYNEKGGGE